MTCTGTKLLAQWDAPGAHLLKLFTICIKPRSLSRPSLFERNGERGLGQPSSIRPGTGRKGWQCTYPHTISSTHYFLLRLLRVLFSYPPRPILPSTSETILSFRPVLTLVRDYFARICYSFFFFHRKFHPSTLSFTTCTGRDSREKVFHSVIQTALSTF